MMRQTAQTGMPDTIVVTLPITIRKRGGRKVVIAPDGSPIAAVPPFPPDTPLVRAIARAYRWQRMLESGEFATIQDLAKAENINPSYVARLLRLCLLAPNVVERLLDRSDPGFELRPLLRPFPASWSHQLALFCT